MLIAHGYSKLPGMSKVTQICPNLQLFIDKLFPGIPWGRNFVPRFPGGEKYSPKYKSQYEMSRYNMQSMNERRLMSGARERRSFFHERELSDASDFQ